jgi:hypothetical protein
MLGNEHRHRASDANFSVISTFTSVFTMKSRVLYPLASALLIGTASSQLFFPSLFSKSQDSAAAVMDDKQSPIMTRPNVVLPPASQDDPKGAPSGPVIISDVMPLSSNINIFAGLTRDITTVITRLEDNTQNTTVLAPLNRVMQALPRKPWEDPEDYDSYGADAYDGAAGEDRAARNLRRFVEAHIIADSPWKEGTKVKTVGGTEIWWELKDGKKIVSKSRRWQRVLKLTIPKIQPGSITVNNVANKVANGEVWILEGVINYAS